MVRNKADITGETLGISEVNGHSLVRLSARTGEGIDVLRNHLKQSMGFDTNMERLAQQSLSEITGEFTSDDLLGRIFSSFCIGK